MEMCDVRDLQDPSEKHTGGAAPAMERFVAEATRVAEDAAGAIQRARPGQPKTKPSDYDICMLNNLRICANHKVKR
jgi:hypothetical protein